MAKNGDCKHEGIMEMAVMDTRVHEQTMVRIRRCGTCGALVKTEEMTEMKRTAERRLAHEDVKRLTEALRESAQMIKRARKTMAIYEVFGGKGK